MTTYNPDNVWLLIEGDEEEASHEANIYPDESEYRVDWYHSAVGQVSHRWFGTLAGAEAWLESNGYRDFSS